MAHKDDQDMNTSDNSTHSSVLEPEDNKLDGKPDDEAEKLADSEHAEGDQDPTEEEKKDEEKKKKKSPPLNKVPLIQAHFGLIIFISMLKL